MRNLDVLVRPAGAIVLLTMLSPAGIKWADEFLPDSAPVGNLYCLEERFADRVIEDMEADGLTVGAEGIASTSYAGGGIPGWEQVSV